MVELMDLWLDYLKVAVMVVLTVGESGVATAELRVVLMDYSMAVLSVVSMVDVKVAWTGSALATHLVDSKAER
jgi:hypothetical protein